MSWIELEQLLAPVSAEAPAGLLLNAELRTFQLAAEGKPERQVGETRVPAEHPDYEMILRQGAVLLAKSKDLRVAKYVARALVHKGGLEGLGQGLELIRGLLELYWAGVHPLLDATDDNDPTQRASQISDAYPSALVATLRATPVLRSDVSGPITLRDLANLTEPNTGGAAALAPAAVKAALQEQAVDALEAVLGNLQKSLDHIASIEAAFATGTGLDPELGNADPPDPSWPRLAPLKRLLLPARQALQLRLGVGSSNKGDTGKGDEGTGDRDTDKGKLPGNSGSVRSREDVMRMLELICGYYERHEPASPLPLILERCRRLVPMSFVEIMSDLAPAGLVELERVTGKLEKKAEKNAK